MMVAGLFHSNCKLSDVNEIICEDSAVAGGALLLLSHEIWSIKFYKNLLKIMCCNIPLLMYGRCYSVVS